ncbi:hypothetical protein [Dysgonomonas macrotermitis]|uniref:Uncharacterized protein n=1 Tax=Dysgonomonas macrotermitis TaxID=1346286 RepID=A0A1M4X2H1_9BACT|nr:hypothetical protein [Dysgonomonas macrotermitis]SHE87681.1 hypothetical protein SAMN05444362_102384 [Dysgonomonas macrotermitis]
MEKLKTILIALLLISLSSCSAKQEKEVEDSYIPKYTTAGVYEKIRAIANDSVPADSVEAFYKEWNRTIEPNSAEYIGQNDGMKEVYQLYKDIYADDNLNRIYGIVGKEGNPRYFVVQNFMIYTVLPSRSLEQDDIGKGMKDETVIIQYIENFRPPTGLPDSEVLYATEEYKYGVENVLAEKYDEWVASALPGKTARKLKRLKDLLGERTPINAFRDSGNWFIESLPFVKKVYFNKNLDLARVDFMVTLCWDCQELNEIYEKKNGTWVYKGGSPLSER